MHGLAADLPRVRFAGPEDEEGILAMVREGHDEAGLREHGNRPLPLSETKVRAMVRRALVGRAESVYGGNVGHAAIGVIGDVGNLQGSIYLSVEEPWYSDAPVLLDIWTYVDRRCRKSQNARMLITFATAVADVLRLPLIMSVMSTEREAAKMRLFERHLRCRPFGAYYLYLPSGIAAPNVAVT